MIMLGPYLALVLFQSHLFCTLTLRIKLNFLMYVPYVAVLLSHAEIVLP